MRPEAMMGMRKSPSETLPMSHIPMAWERTVNPGIRSVSRHEFKHALVGRDMGATVLYISLQPRGNTLGVTTFAGDISLGAFQAAAMASSSDTKHGPSAGQGSDLFQAHMIERRFGYSVSKAKSDAEVILGRYPKEIFDRAADIVAYMGGCSGDDIGVILERAKIELEIERNMRYEMSFLEEVSVDAVSNNEEQIITVVENMNDDSLRITKVIGGVVKEEDRMCKVCLGINSHSEDCPVMSKQKDDSNEENESPKPVTHGNIFSSHIPTSYVHPSFKGGVKIKV